MPSASWFASCLVALHLVPAGPAHAQDGQGAPPAMTPVCAQALQALRVGHPPEAVAAWIQTAPEVRGRDSMCLRAAGAPQPVQAAAVERVRANRAAAQGAHPPGVPAPVASSPSLTPASAPSGPRFDVEFVTVLVAPFKATGAHWDGLDGVASAADVQALALVAGGLTAGQSTGVGVVTSMASKGMDPPDPFGYVELFTAGGWVPGKLSLANWNNNDSNTVQMAPRDHPTLIGVPDANDTKVRVKLYDEDFADHDLIGVAEIGIGDLRAAAAAGTSMPINVSAQTYSQILFVTVAVRPSAAVAIGAQGQVFP